MLVFLLIGGVAADRLPRFKTMLVSDIGRGFLVCAVTYLAFSGRLQVWHIYGLSLAFGFADAFFQPAYAAVVPEITPSELLPSANSLTSLSGMLAGVVGPALGAWIVKLGGTPAAFLLDGVSFFIAAGTLLPFLSTLAMRSPAPSNQGTDVLQDLHQGFKTVIASPWLWITILVAAFANLVIAAPMGVTVPFFVNQHLGLDVDALGLLLSMFSVGSILGAIWLGRLHKIHRRGISTYLCWIGGCAMLALVGLSNSLIPAAAGMFLAGVGFSIGGLLWVNVLQELVPTHLLGRVSSIDQLGSFVLIPIGYGLAGWLTDAIGPSLVLFLGGISAALVGMLGLLHPKVRQLD
jgi:DHA3 family tetracycline resistance protein-like MFS transporter